MSSGLGITFLTGTSISPTDYFAPIGGQYSGGPSRCHKTNTAATDNITKSLCIQCATISLTAVSKLDHLTPVEYPEGVLIGIGLFDKLDSTRSTSLPPTDLIIVALKNWAFLPNCFRWVSAFFEDDDWSISIKLMKFRQDAILDRNLILWRFHIV